MIFCLAARIRLMEFLETTGRKTPKEFGFRAVCKVGSATGILKNVTLCVFGSRIDMSSIDNILLRKMIPDAFPLLVREPNHSTFISDRQRFMDLRQATKSPD
jgi:hypothetical protein